AYRFVSANVELPYRAAEKSRRKAWSAVILGGAVTRERGMRGGDERTEGMLGYVRPAPRVPHDHPLRPIREIVDRALEAFSPQFAKLYSVTGRPSIPPEKLLRALLLQAFYTVRSERQLMEQLEYNLLFRWFVGLSMDAPVW